jgi:P-type E1-E2 ATPase
MLRESEFEQWLSKYRSAQSDLNNRDFLLASAVSELEQDLELLGVTGVEDKLQEDVAQTIECLRSSGIKIWMLTGDKVETATCIAISAGFKSR